MTAIDPYEIAVYQAFTDPRARRTAAEWPWLSNRELAIVTRVYQPGFIRAATARLYEVGLLDRLGEEPPFKYRLADRLTPDAAAYRGRLHEAADALGEPIGAEPSRAETKEAG